MKDFEDEVASLREVAAEEKMAKKKILKKNTELMLEVEALQEENNELY